MRRCVIGIVALSASVGAFAQQATHTPVNKAQVDRWMT